MFGLEFIFANIEYFSFDYGHPRYTLLIYLLVGYIIADEHSLWRNNVSFFG